MKKNKMYGLVLSLSLFFFSFRAYPLPSMEEYWNGTGMSFQNVRDTVTNTSCYVSQINFIGCVSAMNAIFAFHKAPGTLVTDDRHVDYGNVLRDLGPLKLVEWKNRSELLPSQSILEMKRIRKADIKALVELFKLSATVKVDFEALLSYAETSVMQTAKSSALISGLALNANLNVTKDPHTYYMPRKYFEDQNSQSVEEFVGIGISFRKLKDKVLVLYPLEGGPAYNAGMKSKDAILKVDGKDLTGLDAEEVKKLIVGVKGTEVVLTIQRKEEVFELKIVRDLIRNENVSFKMLKGANKNIGYIKVTQFKFSTCRDMENAVDQLSQQKMDALVLDLRGNPGGLLDSAVCMTGSFVGPGKVVVIQKYLSGTADDVNKSDELQRTTVPMVTLINSGSASASEILSGALQDHQRSFVVGDRSFGKGTVQMINSDPKIRGMAIARTIARFFLPSGRTNQITGVVPDFQVYEVPNPTEEDRVSLREEDEYENPLSSEGPAFQQPRPEVIRIMQKCIDETGTAVKTYEQTLNDQIAPDFQLLYAKDVLNCAP